MPRIVVMVSGGGSNLQAILDAIGAGRILAQVVAVVSNRKGAFALERARAAGIPTVLLPLAPYRAEGRSRDAYDADLAEQVEAFQPDLVVCAGWMHVLGPTFLNRFEGRVINLHPALPGELPGTDAIRRAWEEGQAGTRTRTGAMVHHVAAEVDAGPVIVQAELPLIDGEPLDGLVQRVHAVEHQLLVEAIVTLLEGK